jgi:hypothetical protein
MKKQLLAIVLVAMTTVASYAQGTFAFGNSVGTAVKIVGGGIATARNMSAADQAQWNVGFSVYFGPAGAAADALTLAPGTGSFGTVAGVLASVEGNVKDLFAIPGTSADGGTVVSLEIRAVNRATGQVYGSTGVRQVTLGPAAGPAQVIWQGASGTDATRFKPLLVTVPEPSTIALGVLGLGSLLLFRRRK